MCSVKNQFHSDKYYNFSLFLGFCSTYSMWFYRTTSMVSYQGFMFLFTQKPHNAVGCQESEQLDKV